MRIVIKIGTSTLAYATGRLNIRRVEELCRVMCDLKNAGNEIILISSGAIGMGVGKLGLKSRPEDIPTKQAAAAVGQCELMYTYDKLIGSYNHTVAQILLTGEDIENEKRCENFRNTVFRLLELGAFPIVNENDTVAVDELEGRNFGDNDTLSAIVASIVNADVLMILTDIDGVYDKNPKAYPDAKRLSVIEKIDDEVRAMAGGAGSARGTGGMATKIRAAEIAGRANIPTYILSGEDPENLYRIFDGEDIGTVFMP